MQQQRASYLLTRYIDGNISTEERTELEQLTESDQPQLQQAIQQWLESRNADTTYDSTQWQQVVEKIVNVDKQSSVVPAKRIPLYRRTWVRIAAAIMLIIGGYGIWSSLQTKSATTGPQETVAKHHDVAPGKDGAILTLADGTSIVLDSMGNGKVAQQHGSTVILNNGQLTYESVSKTPEEIAYNTMTTPRGRQFQVILPDGTKVWLNAASSLRYPTVFKGSERKVTVTGEAYFEVAKNKAMPFRVSINDKMTVEVLGTHFNVNAYSDEPSISTTLIEGMVKVDMISSADPDKSAVVLKPGQQASLWIGPAGSQKRMTDASPLDVRQVDIEQVIGWKNGAFVFVNADLPAVMRQLARWYDVEVEYAGAVQKGLFNGKIGRGLSLADVLDGLSETSVKFRIESGNRIVILP